MNKKILYKAILILFLILIFTTTAQMKIYAAKGSASASIGTTKLEVGKTTKLTVTATNCFIGYEITSSNPNIVSVSSSKDEFDTEYEKTDSRSYTVTAKQAGSATITVKSYTASGYDEGKFSLSKTFTITVTAPSSGGTTTEKPNNNNNTSSKSSDATLKSITVGGKTYSKPSTSITAPNASSDTSSIKISAAVNNSKAKVSGTGTKDLKTGTNKFTLKVTAENGNTKTYTVTVVRLADESEEPNLPDEEKPDTNQLKLTSLQIEGAELSPDFKDDVFEYSTYIFDLTEVKINAIANDPEAKVEITGNTNLVDGENIVVIKLTKGETSVEYKVKVNKMQLEPLEETQDSTIEEEPKTSKIAELWNRYGLIMIVYSTILISTGVAIGFGITNYRNSDKTKKEKPISKHSKIDFKREDKENTKNDKNF